MPTFPGRWSTPACSPRATNGLGDWPLHLTTRRPRRANMATHEESPSTSRLSWLVGTPRRLGGYVLDAVSSGDSPNTSTAGDQISIREWWRVATGQSGCPYASAALSAREDGMMTCPYAKGQTELPPGHPMIPGMAPSKPANTSAQKFLAVGKSTASTSSSASTAAVADDAAMAMDCSGERRRPLRSGNAD